MFEKYHDIVEFKDLTEMLCIGKNTALKLLHNGDISYFMIGNRIKIPKKSVISYVEKNLQPRQ